MSTITIYTIQNADHIDHGQPATYRLDAPDGSSFAHYIYDTSDYILPEGYHAAESASGTTEIYDAAGRHCPLTDGNCFGNLRGTPHIIDIYATAPFIALKKVED